MKKVVLLLCLLLPSLGIASGFKNDKDAKEFSDEIMKLFTAGEFQKGVNNAKPYWPIPEVEIDGLANKINQQWPMVSQRFGETTGYEFVREEKIVNSFRRYYYLHKFENHAIYWRIDFYKPRDEWKLNNIQFLDNLDILFE